MLTQESNLLKLFSRNQTLVQLLTFSRLKINSKEKNKVQAFAGKCRSKLFFWWVIIQDYSLILAVPLKKSTFVTSCALKTYLLALQEKSKGFKLATIRAIFNLTLTQELNLLGLFSKNQTLVQVLTISQPKINNSKKNKMLKELFPVSPNMNSLQKSKRLNNKTMQKTKTSPQLKNETSIRARTKSIKEKSKNYFSVKIQSQISESNSRAKSQSQTPERNLRVKFQSQISESNSRAEFQSSISVQN